MTPIRTRRRWQWVAFFLIHYNLAANLSNDLYLPSLPALAETLATSAQHIQWTIACWYLGVALPQFFLGIVSDRWGRRPLLLLGGACFLLSTLTIVFIVNVWWLMLARFFQGVGVCSVNVTVFSVVPDVYQGRQRLQVMSYVNMIGYLSPVLGSVMGGYISGCWGWHSNFLLLTGLIGLNVAALAWLLPETHTPAAKAPVFSVKTLGLNSLALLKHPLFLKNLLWYCAFTGGLVAYLSASPYFLIQQLHVQPQHYGFVQMTVFFCCMLGAWWISRLAKRGLSLAQQAGWLKGVLLGISCAVAWHLMATVCWPTSRLAYLAPMVLYAFCLGFGSGLWVNATLSVNPQQQGLIAAFLGFGLAVAGALASFLISLFYCNTSVSVSRVMVGFLLLAYGCVALVKRLVKEP